MPFCVAAGCRNRASKKLREEKGISFFTFPCPKKHKKQFEMWTANVAVTRLGFVPSSSQSRSRLCSCHFEKRMIYKINIGAKLKEDAIPTIFYTATQVMRADISQVAFVFLGVRRDEEKCDQQVKCPAVFPEQELAILPFPHADMKAYPDDEDEKSLAAKVDTLNKHERVSQEAEDDPFGYPSMANIRRVTKGFPKTSLSSAPSPSRAAPSLPSPNTTMITDEKRRELQRQAEALFESIRIQKAAKKEKAKAVLKRKTTVTHDHTYAITRSPKELKRMIDDLIADNENVRRRLKTAQLRTCRAKKKVRSLETVVKDFKKEKTIKSNEVQFPEIPEISEMLIQEFEIC